MAFMVLALSQVVQAFNMRSTHSLFKIGPFSNSKLNWAALASTALVALVTFVPPVRSAFGLIVLPGSLYIWALVLILCPLLVMEAAKALLRQPTCLIYQVAEAVGYKSTIYFGTVFKQSVGLTPREYRDQYARLPEGGAEL